MFHCRNKLVVKSCYFYRNGNPDTGKTASLYWIRPLELFKCVFCYSFTVEGTSAIDCMLFVELLYKNISICILYSFFDMVWHVSLKSTQDKTVTDQFNSLWSRGAIWCHRSGSTLDQVMACCLAAPSHCLIQYCPYINPLEHVLMHFEWGIFCCY